MMMIFLKTSCHQIRLKRMILEIINKIPIINNKMVMISIS